MFSRSSVKLVKWHGQLTAFLSQVGVVAGPPMETPSPFAALGAFAFAMLPVVVALVLVWALVAFLVGHTALGTLGAHTSLAMAVVAAPRQLYPFRQGTRKRRQYLTTFTYNGSTAQQRPTPFNLPNTGYLSRLLLVAHGTIDQSAAGGTLGVDGLAGLFNRITLTLNLGSAAIIDVSGAGADIAARWHGHGASSPVSNIFSLSTTSASPYFYKLPIDIAMNRKRQFALGLINLQDPQVQAQLQLVFNPVTSIASLATVTAGTSISVDVYMEYFEVPDVNRFAQPVRAIARTLEDQFPTATVVGQNIYQIPRLGVMTDFSIVPYTNSARCTQVALQELDIRLNKTDYIEQRSGYSQALLDSTDWGASPGVVPGATPVYGQDNPIQPGVFTWAGWNATDVPDNGDFRDAIDTLEATTTEIIATIATGTTVVASDIIRVVRRVLQQLG